jgi:hypothetical protein
MTNNQGPQMDWKTFFKPTVGKLGILCGILLLTMVLSPLLPSVHSGSPQPKLVTGEMAPIARSPFGIGFPRFFILDYYAGNVGMGPDFFPISLFINVVLWYPLSCLLSLGYTVVRSRSRDE